MNSIEKQLREGLGEHYKEWHLKEVVMTLAKNKIPEEMVIKGMIKRVKKTKGLI
jgi:hypothetical protein